MEQACWAFFAWVGTQIEDCMKKHGPDTFNEHLLAWFKDHQKDASIQDYHAFLAEFILKVEHMMKHLNILWGFVQGAKQDVTTANLAIRK